MHTVYKFRQNSAIIASFCSTQCQLGQLEGLGGGSSEICLITRPIRPLLWPGLLHTMGARVWRVSTPRETESGIAVLSIMTKLLQLPSVTSTPSTHQGSQISGEREPFHLLMREWKGSGRTKQGRDIPEWYLCHQGYQPDQTAMWLKLRTFIKIPHRLF